MAAIPVVQPGVITSAAQNQVFALPARRCLLFCDATSPTFFQSNDPAFGVSVAVTLANGQAELAGAFIRVTSTATVNMMVKTF